MEVSSKLETINPGQAKKYLEKVIVNRPVSDGKCLEYAISMDEGKWSVNGETIKFDDQGRLFDGQHRLHACVLAEKPFKTYVIRGVSDEMAFATVDVGRMRTHGDIFHIAGHANQNNASATGHLIYMLKGGMLTIHGVKQRRFTKDMSSAVVQKLKTMPVRASNITKQDLLAFCEPIKNRITAAVLFADSVKRNRILPTSMIAACYFLFCEKSEIDAKAFFVDLFEGAGLSSTDAVYHLRERLIANQVASQKLTRWMTLALILKAWGKRREGEKTKTLRLSQDEDFPKII